jgi:Ala-tRNA(Pro) deacylase
MECQARLETYLGEHHVPYDVQQHRTAYTAQELAATEHVPGKTVAKVVIGRADGRLAMFVLPAPVKLDYDRAARAVGVAKVELAGENELRAAFPDCEVGAMPPFGNLYGVPMCVDTHLAEDEFIVFAAGTHTTTIKVRYADYERLVLPHVEELGSLRPAFSA